MDVYNDNYSHYPSMLIRILQARLAETAAITDKKAVASNVEMSKLHGRDAGALADA